MKVLILNSGSSSIKYQVFDMKDEPKLLAKGLIERIGLLESTISYKRHDDMIYKAVDDVEDHTMGIYLLFDILKNPKYGVIKEIKDLHAVGHRVVHGGEAFTESTLVDDEVISHIRDCSELAPLHNPANIAGIEAIDAIVPGMKQVVVFDTSFHQTMKSYAYLYGIPYEYYQKYKIRKYGFHGTSHQFVAEESAKFIGKDVNKLRIVTCHLGNGASIAAIRDGKSIDTSMGLTPAEGLLMGTRCGDTGLGVMLYLMEKEGLEYEDAHDMINKKGGLLGVSGISPDMRDLKAAALKGSNRAQIAIDMFAYRVEKYIGSYAFILGGFDLLVFTGGIGENEALVREKICEHMGFVGLHLDFEKNNQVKGIAADITTPESKVKCIVMPTNEELVIARETKRIIKNKK